MILAFVLSILGQVLNTTASLVRGSRMKLILLLVFAANFSFATSYLLNEGGNNGAAATGDKILATGCNFPLFPLRKLGIARILEGFLQIVNCVVSAVGIVQKCL